MTEFYYRHHVFFCVNQRDNKPCCENHDATKMRNYMKKQVKELDLAGKGKVRVNTAGCFSRCHQGPVVVVYPEGIWYTWKTKKDIDEIISEHLQNGNVVERLRIVD